MTMNHAEQTRARLDIGALRPADVIRHAPGRTITEFDDMLVALLTVNQAPLHIDAAYSKSTPHGKRIVNGLFIASIVIGLSNGDFHPDTSRPLVIDAIDHFAPTFYGNTVYVRTEVKSVDIVADGWLLGVKHVVDNEDRKQVMTVDRTFMCQNMGSGHSS